MDIHVEQDKAGRALSRSASRSAGDALLTRRTGGEGAAVDQGEKARVSDSFILFNGGPFTAGRQEIRHMIHLSADGDRFTDTASVNYFDVNDVPVPPFAPLIPGCATATGQRAE